MTDRVCMACKVAKSVVAVCVGFHESGEKNRKMLCPGCAWDATLKIATRKKELEEELERERSKASPGSGTHDPESAVPQ